MSLIAGTTRQSNHSTPDYMFVWTQTSPWSWTAVRYRRDNTTATWTAVLDSITYPTEIGTGDERVSKSVTPRANGWYDYEETWIVYGTWVPETT